MITRKNKSYRKKTFKRKSKLYRKNKKQRIKKKIKYKWGGSNSNSPTYIKFKQVSGDDIYIIKLEKENGNDEGPESIYLEPGKQVFNKISIYLYSKDKVVDNNLNPKNKKFERFINTTTFNDINAEDNIQDKLELIQKIIEAKNTTNNPKLIHDFKEAIRQPDFYFSHSNSSSTVNKPPNTKTKSTSRFSFSRKRNRNPYNNTDRYSKKKLGKDLFKSPVATIT